MARTLYSTDTMANMLHYLLKKNSPRRNADALAFADDILDNELCDTPIGAQFALVYTYVAVAYSRAGIPAHPYLRLMMDSLQSLRMVEQYIAKYYLMVGDHELRAHPFSVYMASIVVAIRHTFRQLRIARAE